MEDKTLDGYDAINDELRSIQASFSTLKLKDAYAEREAAAADAKSYNEMSAKLEKLKKLTEIREYYKKKFKGCEVDVFLEPPFENCSLLGYEKHSFDISYNAFKPRKTKVLTGVEYTGTVSTINNSVNLNEEGSYSTVYMLESIIKSVKTSFYVRITKERTQEKLKLDDKSFNYIDVAYFKKPSKKTTGFKLFKIFSFISSFALIAALIITMLQTIGSNYIIGRQISKGKLVSLGNGFVKFFNSPALQIILLSLLAIYLISQIVVFATTKHYNKCVSIKDFDKLKNLPTQIINTFVILLTFTFFIFTNSVSFAYCAAPNLQYGEASGIFSNLNFIKKFAEIAHLETTKTFTFTSNLEAAIYLGGVAISFCELVGMVYVIGRIIYSIVAVFLNFSNFSDIEEVMNERAKLTDKKLTEYATMLKEFNNNLVTIEEHQLFPETLKRIPSIFDSESNLRKSRKITHLQYGRFNPYKLFIPAVVIPLIGVVFLVFDGIHDVCATNFFPGSNVVKIFCYAILLAISSAACFATTKINDKCSKLDD